ncbi:MAG: hypothetical protein QXU18_06855 [Thermoplasmatales archaeon]
MESETASAEDIIILGNAVPDEISDNRKTVCTAGYSEELGLIRIYPVPPDAKLTRWAKIGLDLERNPRDSRKESWKVIGSKNNWYRLKYNIRRYGDIKEKSEKIALIDSLMDKYGVGCVSELNDRKESLGFVDPLILRYYFAKRSKVEKSVQITLFQSEPFQTIMNYDIQPRLVYSCPKCTGSKYHDQQILEWGAYEYIRKNPEKYEDIWSNFGINNKLYKKRLLIGNQALHRNSFMVISIFRHKMDQQ